MNFEQLGLSNDSVPGTANGEPAPDFLGHLQERLGVDDQSAAARLQFWMSTYQPGPAALAHLRSEG